MDAMFCSNSSATAARWNMRVKHWMVDSHTFGMLVERYTSV
jgi:hypothetical protein